MKRISFPKTRIHTRLSLEMEGENIEAKLKKAIKGQEQIQINMANMNYTERKDGVLPQYDIRTDRWNIALNASDKVSKSRAAARHLEDHPELYEHNEDGSLKLVDGKPILMHHGGEA